MLNLLRQDAARWVVPGEFADPATLRPSQILFLLYRHQGFRAVAWFRVARWCLENRVRGMVALIHRMLLRRYGLEIAGDIKGGLYIAHPVGCVVAVTSMGENCSIIAGVTFGMRNELEFPVVGDEVFVGAGARILGGITIGDGAKIGANSVVMKDVPAGATMVGAPARAIGSDPGSSVGAGETANGRDRTGA